MSVSNTELDDLERLFEEVATQRETELAKENSLTDVPANGVALGQEHVDDAAVNSTVESGSLFGRVGRLTRNLHEALRELGYDKSLEKVVDALPDATDRLTYISTLTRQSAERTLGLIEVAKPIQQALAGQAKDLATQWAEVFRGSANAESFRALALGTQKFLESVPEQAGATDSYLTDIMLAQDFHDLTGQVIHKIVDIASHVEEELLSLLIDQTDEKSVVVDTCSHLNGPVIKADGRTDVVTSQAQVDDLLERLGF